MGKSFKVKNEASRIALVEYLVNKRVRFLEYLRSLHEGEILWMGTVRLTRQDVVRCFGGSVDGRGEKDATVYHLPSMESSEANLSSSNQEHGEDVVVSVGPISGVPHTVDAAWLSSRIPCYLCLAMSLADILNIPCSAPEFVECLYAMLLEMNVRFAAGTTAKALALSNLRGYRQQLHLQQSTAFLTDNRTPSLGGGTNNSSGVNLSSGVAGLKGIIGVGGAFFTLGTSDADNPVKYFYLNVEHNAYMSPTEVRYEEVIIPLCSLLTLAYQRLGDYDKQNNEETLKRIISIDRRLQQMFFHGLSKELGKIARGKLLQQTLLLSTSGLFAGFGSGTHDNTCGLLRDLLLRSSVSSTAQSTGEPRTNMTSDTAEGGTLDRLVGNSDNELDDEGEYDVDDDEL